MQQYKPTVHMTAPQNKWSWFNAAIIIHVIIMVFKNIIRGINPQTADWYTDYYDSECDK